MEIETNRPYLQSDLCHRHDQCSAASLTVHETGIYSGIDEIAAILYTSIDYHPQKQTEVQEDYQMWKKTVRTL